jgi:hypothetical protein
MDGFLDADCVLNDLFNKSIFTRKLWKLEKGTASSYDVCFELADSARIAGFTIFIKGTYHCIGLTALCNHSRRFGVQVDDIISHCTLSVL